MLAVMLSGRYMTQEGEPRNSTSVGTALSFVHAMKQIPSLKDSPEVSGPATPHDHIKPEMSRIVKMFLQCWAVKVGGAGLASREKNSLSNI